MPFETQGKPALAVADGAWEKPQGCADSALRDRRDLRYMEPCAACGATGRCLLGWCCYNAKRGPS
jgi:hypothetical protein